MQSDHEYNEKVRQLAEGVATNFLREQGFTLTDAKYAAHDQVSRTPLSLLKRLIAGDVTAREKMKL